jgi:lysophospholipase L1-like esterase
MKKGAKHSAKHVSTCGQAAFGALAALVFLTSTAAQTTTSSAASPDAVAAPGTAAKSGTNKTAPVKRAETAPKASARPSDTNKSLVAKTAVAKKIPPKKKYQASSSKAATVRAPKSPAVSAATRSEAAQGVGEKLTAGAEVPVENPAALVPFFEQLYRHQNGDLAGPLKLLQYGDSHTAADDWTGDIRNHFQEMFGDGGSGYAFAGSPYRGYRRFDLRSGATKGWTTGGVIGHTGDGIHGLGGISISAHAPRESVYLSVECQTFELYYLKQPGGGAVQVFDNGMAVEQVSTDGTIGPGYYRYTTEPGPHRFEVETLDVAPVRLFGWVAEKATGVTYESLGINGVQASVMLGWNIDILQANLEHRNPALIVLAYGTNEAGNTGWTVERYRTLYVQLIRRLRQAAPTATILVLGPPDRYIHTSKGWTVLTGIDTIVEAQRQAALAEGCAFWDMRAKMGGSGSMRQWVQAGMGQADYVHFTTPGYHKIGDAVFRDLMSQYDIFVKVRESVNSAHAGRSSAGRSSDVLANP